MIYDGVTMALDYLDYSRSLFPRFILPGTEPTTIFGVPCKFDKTMPPGSLMLTSGRSFVMYVPEFGVVGPLPLPSLYDCLFYREHKPQR